MFGTNEDLADISKRPQTTHAQWTEDLNKTQEKNKIELENPQKKIIV